MWISMFLKTSSEKGHRWLHTQAGLFDITIENQNLKQSFQCDMPSLGIHKVDHCISIISVSKGDVSEKEIPETH